MSPLTEWVHEHPAQTAPASEQQAEKMAEGAAITPAPPATGVNYLDFVDPPPLDTYGDPRFRDALDAAWKLHCRKARDYGRSGDCFANIESAKEFGQNPALGVAVRLNDKMSRLKAWATTGHLENEVLEDAFMDIACYGLIGLVMVKKYGDKPRAASEAA